MSLSRFDLIVFDWDGTLSDSMARIIESAQKACADVGLDVPASDVIRHQIGFAIDDLAQEIFPDITPSQLAQLTERFRYHFYTQSSPCVLFDGVVETLEKLNDQGFLLAVATAMSQQGLERALEHTGLQQMFIATRTADMTAAKPCPQMLEEIMEVTAMTPEVTVMVGDSAVDMQLAKNAGVAAIAVKYGAHEQEILKEYEPMACLLDFPSILNLV